jgi:glycosyltransferase involved in cell wall biosynthesis
VRRSILIAHPSADLYGSDRVMLETIEGLRDRGWRVTVTLPAPGPLVPEIERRGGRVSFCPAPVLRKRALKPLGLLKMTGEALRSLPPSIRLIRSSRADLIYVSTLTIPMWLPLGRLMRRPVVCHVHESERSASKWVRRALALPLLCANLLLVNSEFSRGVLVESFGSLRRKSEVIYNGVPGPIRITSPREVVERPLRLLFIGRLAPRKGPQMAIELVGKLAAAGIDARLDLVGAVFPGYEWFEQELRDQVAEAQLADRVQFHGFADDVWQHLADADLVLVPSQGDEPFGNTAVEAVLAARPVIVSASSGLDEAVAGYASAQKVAATDIAGWIAAVSEVLAGWPDYRIRALADVRIAEERHAPELYRERVADRLDEMSTKK